MNEGLGTVGIALCTHLAPLDIVEMSGSDIGASVGRSSDMLISS
ncbi:MAG: hypothetical protein O3C27_07910 [Actinomycetota bacterium]|nr:hypothetical protein [Actinomycetota bacterium]